MKIAWLCPYPVSDLGGALQWSIRRPSTHPCSWIMHLSRALVQLPEVELHVVTLCPWVSRSQAIKKDGLVIHVVKNGMPFLHRGYPKNFRVDAKTSYRLESRKINTVLKQIQPDIVHAHGTENEYALAAMRSGYPWLISIQGIVAEFNKTDPSPYFDIMEPKEALTVKKCRYFTCRTHFDTGFVRRLNPGARIFDIPEAMGPVFFDGQWNSPEGSRVLHVGGAAPRKGLHVLIEAMGQVVEKVPGASIDAVGNVPADRQQVLQELADRHGVKICFHGFRNAAEIAVLHRQCSLFVLCSSNENSPNTLAEAMVSGMPCVAYNVGGVSSMFEDGKSGILIQPHDVAALSARVAELLTDREKAKRMGSAAADFARSRNHPDHVAEETIKAYEFILQNR
jgi:glycosyltransferase involved in cell wall biosynthesis